jgi:ABC-type multidrug transport system ATPase subunit
VLQVCKFLYNYLGAGKTTLLNYLSGREISKNLVKEGSILVNGQEKETVKNFSSYSAYV